MIENLDINTTGIDNIEGYNQINSILSKITFSVTDGTEYPAIIKGLKNVWEVKVKMQGGYDPFQVIQDISNFDNKAVSLSSKEPDKELVSSLYKELLQLDNKNNPHKKLKMDKIF